MQAIGFNPLLTRRDWLIFGAILAVAVLLRVTAPYYFYFGLKRLQA